MSIAKVIEVIGEGDTIEAAIKNAVKEAGKTLHGIKQINVKYIEALVDNNNVTKFRVNAKLTFVIEKS